MYIRLSRIGFRSKEEEVKEKIDNILQYNQRLSRNPSKHTRLQLIVEMAQKEGVKLSISTVTQFLKQYEQTITNGKV